MSEHCRDTLECRPEDLRCAIAIHTRKITDSCRDKDCIEDLRVYMTRESQAILDTANAARVRCAELLYTAIDVTPVAFNQNHYTVDLTFFYKILADAVVGGCRPAALCGLAMFSKRAVLCGESAGAHVFRSDCAEPGPAGEALPAAVVEVLDPMVLGSRVVPVCGQDPCSLQIPHCVQQSFGDELVLGGDQQRLLVTLGQFSIIRLERDAQIIVPMLECAIPTRECCADPGCAEDPCALFDKIPFPADSFSHTRCPGDPGCGCRGYQTT